MTSDSYKKYVTKFGNRQTSKRAKYMDDIQKSLFFSQLVDDKDSLYYIEKLLIQLQGYCEMFVRDKAVVLLNVLYDCTDW